MNGVVNIFLLPLQQEVFALDEFPHSLVLPQSDLQAVVLLAHFVDDL